MNKKVKVFVLAGVIVIGAVGATHTVHYINNLLENNKVTEVKKSLSEDDQLQMFTDELIDMYHDDDSYISASENTYGLNIVKINIVARGLSCTKGIPAGTYDRVDSKLNELRKGLSYLYFNQGSGLNPKIYINLYDTNGKLVDTVNGIYSESDDNKEVDLKWLSNFSLNI